jgi:hypothetical protein
LLVLLACEGDAAETAKAAAETAKDKAVQAAETVKEAGKTAADKTREAARTVADKATDIKQTAVDVLAPHAKKIKGGIESVIVDTTHKATEAAKIATILASAVDRDTTVLPIYQDIGDEAAQAQVDKVIADMPKTEAVDGLTIGFKDLVDLEGTQRTSDSGYLVVWRRGDKLIGFVYRSKMKVDFAKLGELASKVNAGL